MHRPEATLSIGNLLSTGAADLAAHVTIHRSAQERHLANVVHPSANQQFSDAGPGRGKKAPDLFRQMLSIAVENDNISGTAIKAVTEPALDRLSFAPILLVNN